MNNSSKTIEIRDVYDLIAYQDEPLQITILLKHAFIAFKFLTSIQIENSSDWYILECVQSLKPG